MMSLMKNKGTARLRLGRLLTALSIAGVLIVPSSALASEDLQIVTFNGAGWGHGIGMTQFGALGAARDGWVYDQILSYFYQGSSIGTLGEGDVPSPQNIFVNLEPGNGSRARPQLIVLTAMDLITSQTPDGTVPVDLVVARGGESWLAPVDGSITVTRNSANVCDLVIKDVGGNVTTSDSGGSCGFLLSWDGFEEIPTRKVGITGCFLPDFTTGASEPCEYARGQLHIEEAVSGLNLVLEIDINDYVLGISEMPYFWGDEGQGGMEALKAQAVAARSWAFERALSIDPSKKGCDCQLYDEPVSQRYVGWGHVGSIDRWIEAVNATKSQVVTHPDASTETVVAAFYSSSSGGATEDKEDVWGGARLPYLVSVLDPWSLDEDVNTSNFSWGKTKSWSAAGALAVLQANAVIDFSGWEVLTSLAVSETNTSGSASRVLGTGLKDGIVVTDEVNASWIKKIFGLKSVYFRVNEPYPGAASQPIFDDTSGSVHEVNIEWIAAQGITLGCNPPDNTNFCPSQSVTRGQIAAFLNRALGLPTATTDYFNDDDTSIFEADINALAKAGITTGCGGLSYCPQDTVTRGQMAAFLARAFDLPPATTEYFNDDDTSIFEADINALAEAGITVGCNPPTNDQFCPDDPVTRAQMATFLHRALDG